MKIEFAHACKWGGEKINKWNMLGKLFHGLVTTKVKKKTSN